MKNREPISYKQGAELIGALERAGLIGSLAQRVIENQRLASQMMDTVRRNLRLDSASELKAKGILERNMFTVGEIMGLTGLNFTDDEQKILQQFCIIPQQTLREYLTRGGGIMLFPCMELTPNRLKQLEYQLGLKIPLPSAGLSEKPHWCLAIKKVHRTFFQSSFGWSDENLSRNEACISLPEAIWANVCSFLRFKEPWWTDQVWTNTVVEGYGAASAHWVVRANKALIESSPVADALNGFKLRPLMAVRYNPNAH